MEKQINIKSFKILKGRSEMTYEEIGNDRVHTIEDKEIPHPDLKTTLFQLRPFLAKTHHLDKEKYEHVAPTGFKLSGSNNNVCVVTGVLTTPSGKIVAINSEAIDLEGESYPFLDELSQAIDYLKEEATAYFFESKQAQQKIEFNERDPRSDPIGREGPVVKEISEADEGVQSSAIV